MENGGRSGWMAISMGMGVIFVTLVVLLLIIMTFVLTVDSGSPEAEEAEVTAAPVEVTEAVVEVTATPTPLEGVVVEQTPEIESTEEALEGVVIFPEETEIVEATAEATAMPAEPTITPSPTKETFDDE